MSVRFRHPRMNLEAPAEYWEALGRVCGGYRLQKPVVPGTQRPDNDAAEDLCVGKLEAGWVENILLQGIAAVQAHDERVIAWALGEIQRRKELRQQGEVQAKQAEALAALARSIEATRDPSLFLSTLAPEIRQEIEQVLGR